MFKRNSTTSVDKTALLVRTIGRLERDVQNFPRNAELLKEELATAYEALGRAAYETASVTTVATKPAVKKTFATV